MNSLKPQVFSKAATALVTMLLSVILLAIPATATTPWVGGDWTTSLNGTKSVDTWEWDPKGEVLLKSSLRDENYRLFSEISGKIEQVGDEWHSNTEVERLYLRLFFPEFDVTLGKQQINWGTGRAWSPSDLFNPPVALDPDRRRNGVNAALINVPHGPLSFTSVVVAENKSSDKASWGVRHHGYVSGTDWSVFYARRDDKPIWGGDIATDFLGLGIHSELTWEPEYAFNEDGRVLWLLGADYSWADGKLIWMGEYLYDSTGASSKADYNPLIQLVDPEAHLAKHSLFNQLTYAYDEFNSLSLNLLTNLVDQSQAITLSHISTLSTQWQWDLKGTYFVGQPDTEYGQSPVDFVLGTSLTYRF